MGPLQDQSTKWEHGARWGFAADLSAELAVGPTAGLAAVLPAGVAVELAVGLIAGLAVRFSVNTAAELAVGCHGMSHGNIRRHNRGKSRGTWSPVSLVATCRDMPRALPRGTAAGIAKKSNNAHPCNSMLP